MDSSSNDMYLHEHVKIELYEQTLSTLIAHSVWIVKRGYIILL